MYNFVVILVYALLFLVYISKLAYIYNFLSFYCCISFCLFCLMLILFCFLPQSCMKQMNVKLHSIRKKDTNIQGSYSSKLNVIFACSTFLLTSTNIKNMISLFCFITNSSHTFVMRKLRISN